MRSRHVEPARAAHLVDSHQVVERALGDLLCIKTIMEYSIGVCDREHGQTVGLVLVSDRRLQGIRTIVVSVSCNEDQTLLVGRFAKSMRPTHYMGAQAWGS